MFAIFRGRFNEVCCPHHPDAHLIEDYRAGDQICSECGVVGAITHSLRRSALTSASDKGVLLRVLQSISGHSSLEMLQRYIDVRDEAKRKAALAFG